MLLRRLLTMGRDLDEVDRSILYLLQEDARGTSAEAMADKVGVSASTIRNRIEQLENNGTTRGYHPEIEYEAANIPLQVTFVISASPTELQDYSAQIRGIQGVISRRTDSFQEGYSIDRQSKGKGGFRMTRQRAYATVTELSVVATPTITNVVESRDVLVLN